MNRLYKSVGGLLFGVALFFGVSFNPTPAYAVDIPSNIAAGVTVDPCLNNGGAFGFVFCPAVDSFAKVIDYFLGIMQDGFNWSYLTQNDMGGKVLSVWSQLLPIANIVFAVVFLMVIYSIATGSGMNNYSIKKTMPRLILIAVAVNVSYYICAALIDVSNIIGSGVYDLIYGTLANGGNEISFLDLAKNVFNDSTVLGTSGSVGSLLILVVCMLVVLLSVGAVFVGVAARNVIMMMLLLVSPIAFVMALLPNTENLFRKWANNYLRLLVIYPAFMLVWAVSRGLQAVFLSDSVGAPELILAMLLSVAPAIVIIPLFKSSGGLTGKVAGIIQRGSAGLTSSSSTINNQTTNNKVNSQTIDQINQKKFSTNKSLTTNVNNNDAQSSLSNDMNSIANNRTTLVSGGATTTVESSGRDRQGKRSRTLSANLKSQVDISGAGGMAGAPPGANNSSSSSAQNYSSNTHDSNIHNATSSQIASQQYNNANKNIETNIGASRTAINNNVFKSGSDSGLEKMTDAIKSDNDKPIMTRERASSSDNKPTPTPRKQMFTESTNADKKSDKVFDISSKSPVTNVFSGEGQQVAIENNGDISQAIDSNLPNDSVATINNDVLSAGSEDGAPSITDIPDAPSIINNPISDATRKERFAGVEGQKVMANSLKVTNFKDFLPSDIDYILGLGPLIATDGTIISPASDIAASDEYKSAVAVISGYISTLDDGAKGIDVKKWQEKLGLAIENKS